MKTRRKNVRIGKRCYALRDRIYEHLEQLAKEDYRSRAAEIEFLIEQEWDLRHPEKKKKSNIGGLI